MVVDYSRAAPTSAESKCVNRRIEVDLSSGDIDGPPGVEHCCVSGGCLALTTHAWGAIVQSTKAHSSSRLFLSSELGSLM